MAMVWDPIGLLGSLEDAVAVCEPDGTIVFANAAAERLLGPPGRPLERARLWDVAPELADTPLRDALEREAAGHGEASTSTILEIEVRGRCWRCRVRASEGMLELVVKDVTDRKQAEAGFANAAHVSRSFSRAVEHTERDRRRVSALAAASRTFLRAERDPRAIIALVTQVAAEILGELALASLVTPDGGHIEGAAIYWNRSAPDYAARLAAAWESFGRVTPLPGTVAERVLATCRPMRVPVVDVEELAAATRPELAEGVRRITPRSVIAVPLEVDGHGVGTLVAFRIDSSVPYDADDEALLEELAARGSLALENARALEAERIARARAERVAEQTRRLQHVTALLSHRSASNSAFEAVLRESTTALGGAAAGVWDLDAKAGTLVMRAHVGYEPRERHSRIPLAVDAPVCAAVNGAAPVYLANAREYAMRFPGSLARIRDEAPGELATACLPLVTQDRILGALSLTFFAEHEFSPDERAYLEVLASQCAQAIERARLFEQEQAANAAHAETTRKLEAIIRASPAAIKLLELDGTVRLWNPAAERMFGWNADEVLGRVLPAVGEAQLPEFRWKMSQIRAGLPVTGMETQRLTKSGALIDVSIWAAPLERPDGVVQCVSMVVDITDRKRAEKAARDADRRKDEFLAMLGHELRNPLAPIMTALEVMTLRGVTGGERERAIITRQTRHLERLVDDLLDIARITRGKIDLRRTRTDLAMVLAKAGEMAGPLLEQRKHHLDLSARRGVFFVDGDESRLAQVFQNLITNAAKYTPPGGRVSIRLTASDGDAVVEVEDTGDGIPPHLLPTIFDPFVQGVRTVDRSQGGLGLGLALVHSIVTLHCGAVSAFSDGVGKGSRFVVTLPRSTEAEPLAPGPSDSPPLTPASRPRRVLLVDDNQDAAEMLAELLRAAGHEVLVRNDGPGALADAPRFQPDVALLDIGLPVMDGYELARKLSASTTAPLRLVAITGYGQQNDRDRGRDAGFSAHLVKPVDATSLLVAVDG